MNRVLIGLILVIVGVIIILITMTTQYITSQICFFGVLVIGGIISFGVMLILSMKFQKLGWLNKPK
jgi:hypothetical protein